MKSDDASVCHIATGDNLHCLHAVLQLLRLTQALQTCIFYIYTLSQLYLLYILQTIYTNTHTHAQVGGRDLFTVHSLTTLIGTLLPLLIHAIIQINQSPHWGSFTGIWDYNGHLNLVGDDWENTTCFFFPIFNCQGVMFTSHSFVSSIPGTGTKEFLHIKTTWSHQLQGTIVAQNVYRWDAPVCVCVWILSQPESSQQRQEISNKPVINGNNICLASKWQFTVMIVILMCGKDLFL